MAAEPLTIESIDVNNDDELDAFTSHLLVEGNKLYRLQRDESLRLGIIDDHGRLLKTELPEGVRGGDEGLGG